MNGNAFKVWSCLILNSGHLGTNRSVSQLRKKLQHLQKKAKNEEELEKKDGVFHRRHENGYDLEDKEYEEWCRSQGLTPARFQEDEEWVLDLTQTQKKPGRKTKVLQIT